MISYNAKDWFTFIFKIHKAETMKRLLPLLLGVGLYAGSWAFIENIFLPENKTTTLKHNQILTLYHENNEEKFYRFIFYNRLLDPQA